MNAPHIDNRKLLAQIRCGSDEALDALIRANMGLVRSIALRFTGRGIELDDLVQTGVIGMIRAAKSFDEKYGCAFSTYAVPIITGEIKRMLRDDGTVKVGRELKRRAAAAARARERIESERGREARLSEVAAECGLSPEETAEALAAYSPVRSLSEPVDGENSGELEQFIADPEDAYERVCESSALKAAIGSLDEFERRVVYLRYTKELSQTQTGAVLGVSQVKISRSEKKIIERLRQMLIS